MNANSAASIMTKDVDDLALGEVVQVSAVVGLVVMAVLLAFGIKTYAHWRRLQWQDESATKDSSAETDRHSTPVRAPRIEVRSVLGDLRSSGTMRHSFEDRH